MIEETQFHKAMKMKLTRKRIADRKMNTKTDSSSEVQSSYRIINEDDQDKDVPLITGAKSNEVKPFTKLPDKKVIVTQN